MRRRPAALLTAFLAAAALLPGCATLPRGAAVSGEVLRVRGGEAADFAVYPITTEVLPLVATWPQANERPGDTWLPRQRGPASSVLRSGDRVDVAIWDTGENSLLTAPGQKVAAMPNMEISPAGEIFIPYVGEVYVANLTPQAARGEIQDRIETVLPSAQVQLTLNQAGRGNSVDLVGGVARPGPVPLPDRDFTLLSLLGQGGGPAAGLRNPQVRLVRDGQDYAVSLDRLYADPALDTTLRGGDQVIVVEDERAFLSLGAAGSERIVHFETDTVSALEAMSMIGGLNDARGNPQGILILREYPANVVREDAGGPDKARVVFTLDLTTADGLFAARNFLIRPGDLVLATESPVTSAETVLGLFGRSFGIVRQANALN